MACSSGVTVALATPALLSLPLSPSPPLGMVEEVKDLLVKDPQPERILLPVTTREKEKQNIFSFGLYLFFWFVPFFLFFWGIFPSFSFILLNPWEITY